MGTCQIDPLGFLKKTAQTYGGTPFAVMALHWPEFAPHIFDIWIFGMFLFDILIFGIWICYILYLICGYLIFDIY